MEQMKEAEVNYVSEPWATCPYCGDEVQLASFPRDDEIKCEECGKEYYYSLDI